MSVMLTAKQVLLLKTSFRAMNASVYSDHFYKRLFELHPQLRALFPTDMAEQKAKLMSVFELIVYSFEEKKLNEFTLQDSLLVPLRNLGRKHEEKGVIQAHYPIANELMLETLQYALGKEYSEEIRQAWKLALAQITAAMLNNSVKTEQSGMETGDNWRDVFKNILQKIKG
jgi:hemoglobin-like flavoprotein